MRTTVLLSCIVALLSVSHPSKAQTEVMAWGNLTGIRVEGQLMEFETSLILAGSNWTNVNATGKERQRPKYQREGDTQTVQTDLGGVQFVQQVKENGRGSAKVSVSATAKADTTLQGVYFSMALPARYYANATFRLNGSKTLKVSDLSDKSYSVTSLRIESEKRQIELSFDAKSLIILRKLPDDSGVQVLVTLMGPKLVKNKTHQKEIVITASGQIDHSPAQITIDANSPGRLFVGFGGNFRLQNPKADPQVIQYCLDNMRVAYGRVEMPWQLWHPDENADPIAEAKSGKFNDHVHKSMLMAQQLAKLGMPVIVSDWQAPGWAIQRDRRDRGMYRSGYALNSQKRDKIYKSIADYLVYLKQNYGVEAEMFSFNESDLGINVFHTAQEHADFIKGFGAYMASCGLATRMLLGDNSDATTFDFILPAMNDPETHKYIGAVSFHSWRGCDDATLKKWAGAAQQLNVPLIIGEGSTDAAAHSYAQIFYEQTFALYEINLYVRLCAVCQPLSILQWQLTSDYSLLKGEGIYGTQGPLAPTRRFWNVKQLASTPENAFSLPTVCDKEEINCASFGNIARGEYAIHMVNNGAERETTIKGIPAGVSAFDVYVTDENKGMEKVQEVSVVNGSIVVKLPPASFATLISKK